MTDLTRRTFMGLAGLGAVGATAAAWPRLTAKTANVDDRHRNTPVFVDRGNHYVTPKLSNSPRDGPESAKTVIVDDRHVSAPWGSTTMEIALGPQKVSNSP